jgi:hypothetical protein
MKLNRILVTISGLSIVNALHLWACKENNFKGECKTMPVEPFGECRLCDPFIPFPSTLKLKLPLTSAMVEIDDASTCNDVIASAQIDTGYACLLFE